MALLFYRPFYDVGHAERSVDVSSVIDSQYTNGNTQHLLGIGQVTR